MAPKNPVTGTVYKGSNRLILMIAAKKCAYQDPRWLTYKTFFFGVPRQEGRTPENAGEMEIYRKTAAAG